MLIIGFTIICKKIYFCVFTSLQNSFAMYYPILDTVVLDTIQATAADLTLANNKLSFTGSSVPIPFRNIHPTSPYTYTVYSAGVAQISNAVLNSANISNNTYYTLVIDKRPATLPGLVNSNFLYNGREEYSVSDTAATATTIAHNFALAIQAAKAQGGSSITASDATGTLTLTGMDANFQFTYYIKESSIVTSYATTTVYVAPSGSYAQVKNQVINGQKANLNTGHNYDTYAWLVEVPVDTQEGQNKNALWRWGYILVFAQNGATNAAALKTAIDAANGGTATASKYLGIL